MAMVCNLSCDKDKVNKTEPEETPGYGTTNGRTVLVYLVAENSLATFVVNDVKEMLLGAKYLGANDRVVVYIDDRATPRIYAISFADRNKSYEELLPVMQYESDKNSSATQSLDEFIRFGETHYPAPSYGIILWSHGSGWVPPYNQPVNSELRTYGARIRKSFGLDNELNSLSNKGYEMSIDSLRYTLEKHRKFDFLLFDACFMQNIEVAYELRNTADFIIGSPAEIPGEGAPYDRMMHHMFSDGNYVKPMVEAYYKGYKDLNNGYGVLLNAVRTDSLERFADITAPLVKKYKEKLMTMDHDTILNYFRWDYYPNYSYPDFYDMRGIMQAAMSAEDYEYWDRQFNSIIECNPHTSRWFSEFNQSSNNRVYENQYSGISMHIPLKKYADRRRWFTSGYYLTEWAQKVWNDNETNDIIEKIKKK